ncbi:hypothetical protein Pmani_005209 [Petrolisthes manimaculis]|uniref:Uncharacterized protein n=1 Tax=Petrolisthes manimaculis TaxID=1843537 RepID=A0AAE1QFI6_9EUCA|nr:hypothetical protein Pmani_005209 [Petrolisthes manimaculis]
MRQVIVLSQSSSGPLTKWSLSLLVPRIYQPNLRTLYTLDDKYHYEIKVKPFNIVRVRRLKVLVKQDGAKGWQQVSPGKEDRKWVVR